MCNILTFYIHVTAPTPCSIFLFFTNISFLYTTFLSFCTTLLCLVQHSYSSYHTSTPHIAFVLFVTHSYSLHNIPTLCTTFILPTYIYVYNNPTHCTTFILFLLYNIPTFCTKSYPFFVRKFLLALHVFSPF